MSLYNIYHNRSEFKIGERVIVCNHAGLDSGKKAVVIEHFNWREEAGAYKAPEKTHIPIQFDNGNKSYFPRNYLKKPESLCKSYTCNHPLDPVEYDCDEDECTNKGECKYI